MSEDKYTASTFEETVAYRMLLEERAKESRTVNQVFIDRVNADKTLTPAQIDALEEDTLQKRQALYWRYDALEANMRRDFNALKGKA